MPEWVILLLPALMAALPGLYATWRQRNLVNAEATQKVAEAAVGLLDDFREQIRELRQRTQEWEIERQILHETLMSCIGQNRMLQAEVARLEALLRGRETDDGEGK